MFMNDTIHTISLTGKELKFIIDELIENYHKYYAMGDMDDEVKGLIEHLRTYLPNQQS